MQGPTRTIEIGGRVYTARQPTLNEMINFFDSPPATVEGFEVVESLLIASEEVAISDLLTLTDATSDDLKSLAEDDLVALANKIKEVNPRFFQMRSRLDQMGREIAELLPQG